MNNISTAEESISNSIVPSSTRDSYRCLSDFLWSHRYDKSVHGETGPTHTRIGDDRSGIHGGAYYIPDEE